MLRVTVTLLTHHENVRTATLAAIESLNRAGFVVQASEPGRIEAETPQITRLRSRRSNRVPHKPHEVSESDLAEHLVTHHGWTPDMALIRSADRAYQPRWHQLAHSEPDGT